MVRYQELEIRSSQSAFDGVRLLCSLVVDSITSPYIDGSGERIPVNLISKITNPRVLDHLNLISVACKDHNTLLPVRGASISRLRLDAAGLPISDEQRGKSALAKPGSPPRRVKRTAGAVDTVQTSPGTETDSSHAGGWQRAGRGGGRWPRWKLSAMIDGRASVSERAAAVAGGHDLLL